MAAWEELIAGNFFDSIIAPFTPLIGSQLFYLLIVSSMITILFLKTKSWGVVGVGLMLVASGMIPVMLLQSQKYFILLIVGGVVVSLYGIFKKQ